MFLSWSTCERHIWLTSNGSIWEWGLANSFFRYVIQISLDWVISRIPAVKSRNPFWKIYSSKSNSSLLGTVMHFQYGFFYIWSYQAQIFVGVPRMLVFHCVADINDPRNVGILTSICYRNYYVILVTNPFFPSRIWHYLSFSFMIFWYHRSAPILIALYC